MKHLHMLMAFLTIAIFIYQAVQVFSNKPASLPKAFKIGSHIIYTLLIIAGAVSVIPLLKSVGLPVWVLAKLVLFIVAISATIKATHLNANASQAKAGIFIAGVCYIAILGLAFSKPAIGFLG